ncbi:MAG: GlsB/YeaQ/YmgE family stress response membrane protein [Reyranella sp.]|uniref:GlsB/YeaQ/YmgE family stress response membrane protein n=1 Tax=Reyranella sp. TaxID=1929291 RepID=UPI0027302EF2|nr:GlsB/YeaQ/YmgE family stress response membrane protein [Reyranella sp.]MDP1965455.1 GlsB/YeaQ/YmgE family stress response membrane protein [Reyranella sp.]MDP2376581.1 GlsB/YeaQ/YmgE family stress response membrane protein [Reyranella sp.]
MNMSTESIVVILLVGIVAGWLAGKIVRGTGFGLVGDLLVGIAGAFVASWLFPRFGIQLGTGIVSAVIYSALGAVILLLVVSLIRGRGRL